MGKKMGRPRGNRTEPIGLHLSSESKGQLDQLTLTLQEHCREVELEKLSPSSTTVIHIAVHRLFQDFAAFRDKGEFWRRVLELAPDFTIR